MLSILHGPCAISCCIFSWAINLYNFLWDIFRGSLYLPNKYNLWLVDVCSGNWEKWNKHWFRLTILVHNWIKPDPKRDSIQCGEYMSRCHIDYFNNKNNFGTTPHMICMTYDIYISIVEFCWITQQRRNWIEYVTLSWLEIYSCSQNLLVVLLSFFLPCWRLGWDDSQ